MKTRKAMWLQGGRACVGCSLSPWRGRLGAVAGCYPLASQDSVILHIASSGKKSKFQIPSTVSTDQTLLLPHHKVWKIHCKPESVCICCVPDTVLSVSYTLIDSIFKITLLVEILLITEKSQKLQWKPAYTWRQFIDSCHWEVQYKHTPKWNKQNSNMVTSAWILDIFSSPFYVP